MYVMSSDRTYKTIYSLLLSVCTFYFSHFLPSDYHQSEVIRDSSKYFFEFSVHGYKTSLSSSSFILIYLFLLYFYPVFILFLVNRVEELQRDIDARRGWDKIDFNSCLTTSCLGLVSLVLACLVLSWLLLSCLHLSSLLLAWLVLASFVLAWLVSGSFFSSLWSMICALTYVTSPHSFLFFHFAFSSFNLILLFSSFT